MRCRPSPLRTPAGAVSIESTPFDGEIYFTASTAAGVRRRLDAAGAAAPLEAAALKFFANALEGSEASAVPQLIEAGDDFYFSHHSEPVVLPVYRLIHRSAGTRYYIDPVSGMLVAKIDRSAQAYRWLHQGLHRMDFAPSLRHRPRWDALMLVLMSGVTLVCATGTYLGFRRMLR